jgi:hypothetical protein
VLVLQHVLVCMHSPLSCFRSSGMHIELTLVRFYIEYSMYCTVCIEKNMFFFSSMFWTQLQPQLFKNVLYLSICFRTYYLL